MASATLPECCAAHTHMSLFTRFKGMQQVFVTKSEDGGQSPRERETRSETERDQSSGEWENRGKGRDTKARELREDKGCKGIRFDLQTEVLRCYRAGFYTSP